MIGSGEPAGGGSGSSGGPAGGGSSGGPAGSVRGGSGSSGGPAGDRGAAGHRADARPQVVLVRHGETEWSLSGQHTGRTDIPLNELGRRQAALAGARLLGRRWAQVLTSPLARALDTCRLAGLGDEAAADSDLMEWAYGAYEGKTTSEIRRERPTWWLWTDGCPDGEDADEVGSRADRVIARCLGAEGDTAVFAHGHYLRVLAARWIGAGPALGASLLSSTSSVSLLGWERTTPVIARWNDTSHLEGGPPIPA